MCGSVSVTHDQWRERAEASQVSGGGKRFELTDLYGPDGKRGLLIKDSMFPVDYRVTLVASGTDLQTFTHEADALKYVTDNGFIVPTEMQLSYIERGTDIFEMYGGKRYADWIAEGDLNRRQHVHPEPPEDENDIAEAKKFVTAYAMTMTAEEAMSALGSLMGMGMRRGSLFGRSSLASPDLSELLGIGAPNPFAGDDELATLARLFNES